MQKRNWLISTVAVGMLAACGGTDGNNTTNNATTNNTATNNTATNNTSTTMQTLSLSSSDLPELGDGYVYEGWIIVDGAPVTTGRFSADEGGGIDADFEVDAADLEAATKFVLSIEPETGDDPAPSAVKFLAGDIVDGMTSATISDGAVLGTDFGDASGGYILAVPSDDGMGTYNNGIWFLDPDAGPGTSLTLPTLPEGWAYEGWVVTDDGPVSTGRFTDLAAADSDGAGPASGPNEAPPFPGQDFVATGEQIDLIGKTVVISVEPQPDDSPAPFTLKPLVGEVEDVGAMTLQSLDNMASAPTLEVSSN